MRKGFVLPLWICVLLLVGACRLTVAMVTAAGPLGPLSSRIGYADDSGALRAVSLGACGTLGPAGPLSSRIVATDANGALQVCGITGGGGGGDVATDAIWVAAGDQVVGTGSATAHRVAKGTALQYWRMNSGATAEEWATASWVNADINASAAIVYSKLSLTGGIINADINASAAIAYSKLSLTGAILNADLAGSIAASKLVGTDIATVGTITTGVWSGTDILFSKIAQCPTGTIVSNLTGGTADNACNIYSDVATALGIVTIADPGVNAVVGWDDTDNKLYTIKIGTGLTYTRGGSTDYTISATAGAGVATDAIWAAAGDLVYGTGNDTASILSKGTAYQKLRINSGATAEEWATVTGTIQYNFGNCQGSTAVLGFNLQGSGAMTVACGGSTIINGIATAPDASTSEVQMHFRVPDDWDGTAMTLSGFWRTTATSGNAIFQFSGVCSGNAAVMPTAYSATPDTVTEAALGTTLQENAFSITLSVSSGHSLDGCAAGQEVFGRFFRDPSGSDTLGADVTFTHSIGFVYNKK